MRSHAAMKSGAGWMRRWLVPAGVMALAPAFGEVTILDVNSRWRMQPVYEAPVMEAGPGRMEPLFSSFGARHRGTAELLYRPEPRRPDPTWVRPEFDDGAWIGAPALRAPRTPFLCALHLRGYFQVTDPAAVRDLTLSLAYHGGAIVHVNGREVARGHLAPDGSLAEPYSRDAFVGADGRLLSLRGDPQLWGELDAETARRVALRERRLDVPIPAALLRAGVNVVAIELVRAPYDPVVNEQLVTLNFKGEYPVHDLSWNTGELRRARLRAASDHGLQPAGAPPSGFLLWNSDVVAIDFDLDWGNPAEPLRPIRLAGTRNGVFSGKVVLGSDRPVRGLRAAAGPLRGPAGVIPADRIQIRYARPWGSAVLTHPDSREMIPYQGEPEPLLALFDAPPGEISARTPAVTERSLALPGLPAPVQGAVVPVWVTVHVPADAAPGAYEGEIRLAAEDQASVAVPVRLEVAPWRMPDPGERRTWIELIQSPDTLALEYKLEPWSEAHFAMIARSMGYLRAMGSRVLYAPLIAESNMGNDHSIVRWVKTGPGPADYRFDFSVLDRYLDVALRTMGPPEIIVLNVWDFYLVRDDTPAARFSVSRLQRHATTGPKITLVDPGTGAVENIVGADYTTPEGEALWTRLFGELRAQLRARGLEQAMMLGMTTDVWAARDQVAALSRISGGLRWVNAAHYRRATIHDGLAEFGYHATHFSVQWNFAGSRRGWANPERHVLFDRLALDGALPVKWRGIAQQAVTANVRGVGRLGADTWPAVRDRHGRRQARVWERFPGADWGYLNIRSSTLAPGPEGPVATTRYEWLREGAQECEARIVLEGALAEAAHRAALGPDLVERCEALLREHQLAMWRSQFSWQTGASARFSIQDGDVMRAGVNNMAGYLKFLASGWQQRSLALYHLAAEVERKRTGP